MKVLELYAIDVVTIPVSETELRILARCRGERATVTLKPTGLLDVHDDFERQEWLHDNCQAVMRAAFVAAHGCTP